VAQRADQRHQIDTRLRVGGGVVGPGAEQRHRSPDRRRPDHKNQRRCGAARAVAGVGAQVGQGDDTVGGIGFGGDLHRGAGRGGGGAVAPAQQRPEPAHLIGQIALGGDVQGAPATRAARIGPCSARQQKIDHLCAFVAQRGQQRCHTSGRNF